MQGWIYCPWAEADTVSQQGHASTWCSSHESFLISDRNIFPGVSSDHYVCFRLLFSAQLTYPGLSAPLLFQISFSMRMPDKFILSHPSKLPGSQRCRLSAFQTGCCYPAHLRDRILGPKRPKPPNPAPMPPQLQRLAQRPHIPILLHSARPGSAHFQALPLTSHCFPFGCQLRA